MLWCQFIQTFGLHESTAIVLGKEYHFKRVRNVLLFPSSYLIGFFLCLQVKRLSEGFFHREIPRSHLLTSEGESYNDLHDLVRNSQYYSRLPVLTIECVELDGVPDTLPILIEEVYSAIEQKPMPALSASIKNKSNGGMNDNPLVQAVQNFSKSLFKGI